ncbi:biosynthetic arginine decarboxylase [Simiduia agarivorans]|uniref:Biosynthetic arginine decarboxylase n=1 Tax=Simiduia agarivorans (strain DSM 21679 / JCM 13881 / BCRC 17597 / SA1) TaxID=1117647 RepID=K4KX94_SIMAS|nr:biosynthetic arginine decarboxylase [Simiduia agarivorans]AFU98562.1 arginine decarboxylase [Simiduia agarivorans SA1 = DSM 21679]
MNWSIDDSRELYNITHWSDGYFDVNDQGELIAKPDPDKPAHTVSLMTLVKQAQALGMTTPLLVRFNDILHDRVDRLCGAFDNARERLGYKGQYRAVYPIKVNQQHDVVEQLLLHGGQERFGLEAGSKPELMAVIGLAKPGSVIVCNGYKDREYIRTALIAEHLGHQVYIVVEKMSEMNLVLEEARNMGVSPRMGVRVRLASQGKGKWQSSGGEKSKFGLSPTQILSMVDTLKAQGQLQSLQLVHYHLGSQLANIRDIQHALREAARYFAELHALGVNIGWVDVGGGLGVDYEGTTSSRSSCSTNYTMQEYANKVVSALVDICDENNIEHPNIISESGRAMTAHHAVLITDVIGVEETIGYKLPNPVSDDDHPCLQDLWHGFKNISKRTALEIYHDAVYSIGEAHSLYVHGSLNLQEWARASELYAATCVSVREVLQNNPGVHAEILDELNEKLADKVFCNFSLFQSLPDAWAIDQVFPVLPLHYLDRAPERRAILQDITCDSDGKLDMYVEGEGIEPTLPMPRFDEDKPLYLGMFMVGAYQEILGDLHNLFGDTHSMHVGFKDDGSHEILNPLMGDTVADMLACVDFDVNHLMQTYAQKLAASDLPEATQKSYLAELQSGMNGYSYLEE